MSLFPSYTSLLNNKFFQGCVIVFWFYHTFQQEKSCLVSEEMTSNKNNGTCQSILFGKIISLKVRSILALVILIFVHLFIVPKIRVSNIIL